MRRKNNSRYIHDAFSPIPEADRDLQVIQKFKAGEFNLLVSTSIGEEGLDIGEIDLIVCYDAQKTPIRMVRGTQYRGVRHPNVA